MQIQTASKLYMSNYPKSCTSFHSMRAITNTFNDFIKPSTDYKEVSVQNILDFANLRRETVKATTLSRNLTTISSMLDAAAIIEANKDFENPVKQAKQTPYLKRLIKRKPATPRRVHPENITLLKTGITANTKPILNCMLLARETGMRASKIARIKPEDIDFISRTITIPTSKTTENEIIPISKQAHLILKKWPFDFFKQKSERWVSSGFKQVKNRASEKHPHLKSIRFHDFRHECIYQLFKKGLNIKEVAAVSRHKDPLILLNYLHVSHDDIYDKLW